MDKIIDIAKGANNYLDKSRVNVPILNDLKLIKNENKSVIFVAVEKGIVEQFLCDGSLNDGETFESRIDRINSNLSNCDVRFYNDYKKLFDYKIYIQDMKVGNRFIKQMSAYFVDDNKFYQISLAIGPYDSNDEDDLITTNLYNSLKSILDNTSYIGGE